jgi:hypothetical protein
MPYLTQRGPQARSSLQETCTLLRLAGTTNIASATRWLARNSHRTLPPTGLLHTDFADTMEPSPASRRASSGFMG